MFKELCPDDDEDDDLGPESEDNNEEPQSVCLTICMTDQ